MWIIYLIGLSFLVTSVEASDKLRHIESLTYWVNELFYLEQQVLSLFDRGIILGKQANCKYTQFIEVGISYLKSSEKPNIFPAEVSLVLWVVPESFQGPGSPGF